MYHEHLYLHDFGSILNSRRNSFGLLNYDLVEVEETLVEQWDAQVPSAKDRHHGSLEETGPY